jgi:uncharacterized protein (TIGR03435 family)
MTLQTLLIHPAVRSLGWALLHFLWQGALLAVLFFVADTLTRRAQARLRYAIGCLTMLLMPAVFVATIFRSHPFLAPASSVQDARVLVVPGAEAMRRDSPPRPDHGSVGPVLPGRHSPSFEPAAALPGFVVCLWLGGIVALSICTAGGWIRVRRLRWRGVEPVTAAWFETVEGLIARLQVSRPVRLYTSALAEAPMVIGLVRPYILFPVAAITGLSESQLRAVLAHELAHIRRHDYLVNLLQTAVETLLFYHPAVWWISRRVRQEREHCCDDLAVEVCGDVMEYAGALAQLEELRGCISEPALAATGGDLLARIRRLMGQSRERSRDRIPGPLGVTLAVAVVLGAALGVGHTPAIHAQSSPPHAAPAAPAPVAQIQAAPVPAPPAQAKTPQPPAVVAPQPEVATSQEKPAGKLPEFEVASTKPFERGILLMAPVAAAQTGVPAPAFEVASVKRYTPQLRPGIRAVARSDPPAIHFQVSGTRVSAIGNLLALVRLSYDLAPSHVRLSQELADNWATSEVYEIDARAPGDAIPTLAQVREMMQTLLAERFQLKVSRRNQVMPVYNLVVSPGGPKLTPTAFADDAPLTRDEGSTRAHFRLRYLNFSMSDLVEAVRRQFDRPLLDKTGLTGGFDFSLDYIAQPPAGMPAEAVAEMDLPVLDPGLPIVASLREQLGLRVVPAREQIEILVIDHAERPSVN